MSMVTGGEARTNAERFLAADVLLRHLRRGGAAGLPALTEAQWDAVVDEAIRQKIAPLAWHRLTKGPATIPAPVLERLRELYLRHAFRNGLLLRQVAELAAMLGERGVPVVLLKGAHLAPFTYPNPALRSMADIDLLVPTDRLAEVDDLFVEWGWGPLPRPDIEEYCRRFQHTAPLRKEGWFPLEVHWSIERPTSPFSIDLDELWARTRTADLNGERVSLLSTEDLLLHMCLHASYHHRFNRAPLKSLVDVAMIADRHEGEIDWGAVARRAAAWRASRFVYTTLRLTRDLLDAGIPESALATLSREPADEDIVRAARQYIVTPPIDLPVAYQELRSTHGLREVLAWLTRNIFLSRERMRVLYGVRAGSPLVYAYYVFRPIDLLIRRGLLMLRVALRTPAVKPTLERERSRDRINAWVAGAESRAPRDGNGAGIAEA